MMRWLRPASWNRNNLRSWQILENSRVTGAESCDGRFLWVKFWLRQISTWRLALVISSVHFHHLWQPPHLSKWWSMMIPTCSHVWGTMQPRTRQPWWIDAFGYVQRWFFLYTAITLWHYAASNGDGLTGSPWRTDDLPADEQLEFVASNQGWQWKFPQWEWTDNLWKMFLFKMGAHDLRLIWINLIILLVKMGLSKNMVSPIPLVHHPFKTSHY